MVKGDRDGKEQSETLSLKMSKPPQKWDLASFQFHIYSKRDGVQTILLKKKKKKEKKKKQDNKHANKQ